MEGAAGGTSWLGLLAPHQAEPLTSFTVRSLDRGSSDSLDPDDPRSRAVNASRMLRALNRAASDSFRSGLRSSRWLSILVREENIPQTAQYLFQLV